VASLQKSLWWRPSPDRDSKFVPFWRQDGTLPFKLTTDQRHHSLKQKLQVTNWPAYGASLCQRGRRRGSYCLIHACSRCIIAPLPSLHYDPSVCHAQRPRILFCAPYLAAIIHCHKRTGLVRPNRDEGESRQSFVGNSGERLAVAGTITVDVLADMRRLRAPALDRKQTADADIVMRLL